MRIWVVPHTHWDREWYLPFQHFRLRLVRTVDEIVEVLESDPAFRKFTLDGQASVIDDYLSLNPSGASRLATLIKDGRISIGPWYTQPDEFLVGQESLVRNLLVGKATCAPFGPPMSVGYVPDIFGHVAQLPQVLRGFGIDNCMFWRGLGPEADELGVLFRWRAPDGSEVMAIRLLQGYGNAVQLGVEGGRAPDVDRALARIEKAICGQEACLGTLGVTDLLLCNGGDHERVQSSLPSILKACELRLSDVDFRVGSYEDYAEVVRPVAERGPVYAGEMVSGYSAPILRGVNSTRMYLKQDNESAERALLQAEILSSLAALRGKRYPKEAFDLAWKELLRNHAHDSICGCSVDEVHRDMRARSAQVMSIAERLRREALAELADEEAVWSYQDRSRDAYSVVNVLPWTRCGVAELRVPESLQGRPLRAETRDGVELPVQVMRSTDGLKAVAPVTVPGFGSIDIALRPGRRGSSKRGVWVEGKSIENEFYRVEAQDDGALTVVYKPTDLRLRDVHFFLDEADRGDEYTYCPAAEDKPWTSLRQSARTRTGVAGPVVASLTISLKPALPVSLAPSRERRTWERLRVCPIYVEVRLLEGVDRLEFRTQVDNRVRDHRLRVVFPGPAALEARAESTYQVVRRPLGPFEEQPDWIEQPTPTQATQGAVGVGYLSVFTRGLPEYEAWSEGDASRVAVTLLRCVDRLSRGDLTTRRGEAGPSLYTPEAQCLGTYTFEYAICLKPDLGDADFVRAAHDYRYGFTAGPAGAKLDGLLRVEGQGFCLGALKGAENGRGVILRLYNPGSESARVTIGGRVAQAELVRLDEEPLAGEMMSSQDIAPGRILTLRLI